MPNRKTQIVVVGGRAGGLELVRKLGARYGRKAHDIIPIDRNLTQIWKPLLYEVAVGSLDATRKAATGSIPADGSSSA